MAEDSYPTEVLMYGSAAPLSAPRELKAGPLNVRYEKGSIRYVTLNGAEVVRMVYAALRDHNWDTIEPEIIAETIQSDDHSFSVSLRALYKNGDIHFEADYRISGGASGEIRLEMDGRALSDFRKNRLGFCVLHPVNECSGNRCDVTHPDGRITEGVFPKLISPHQPFKDIQRMRWLLPDGTAFIMQFEGDIFEMEDQRNWTDASYKTYCTPLGIPFPVQVKKGDTIRQAIVLSPEAPIATAAGLSSTKKEHVFKIITEEAVPLPRIGVGRSSEVDNLSNEAISRLRALAFNHYRIDVKLANGDWKRTLSEAAHEAKALGLALEVALHLPSTFDRGHLQDFAGQLEETGVKIDAIIVLQDGVKATPDSVIAEVVPVLCHKFSSAKIGAGTDAYFAELNRNRITPALVDFISFSINPQVHAFDNASLIESLEAQGACVKSAHAFARGRKVRVTPVTLKPRFNPNATGPEPTPLPGQMPSQVDVRQRSLFAAGWTLGSLKYLAMEGADSVTYYETVGRKGLFMADLARENDALFPASSGEVFPVYQLLKAVAVFAGGELVKTVSSDPLHFDGCALRKENAMRILLANFGQRQTKMRLTGVTGHWSYKVLDASIMAKPSAGEYSFAVGETSVEGDSGGIRLTLPAFAIGVLDRVPLAEGPSRPSDGEKRSGARTIF